MEQQFKEKILFIDDDLDCCNLISQVLQSDGYRVVLAYDGLNGLKVFQEQAPDLVITDLRMPGLDGLEVLKTISEETPDIPVIIISGLGNLQDAVSALRLGAYDYIIKPVQDIEIFLHTVAKALEHKKLSREINNYHQYLEEEIKKRTLELEKRKNELEEINCRLITEIKERSRVGEALRVSEEKYRLLIENQTDLVIKLDREGRLIFVSQTYCEIFARRAEEVLGKKLMHLVQDEDKAIAAKKTKELYKPPYSCYFVQKTLTKQDWRWIAWSYKAILDQNNKVESIVGVGRDVTDEKRAEEELRKAHEELEHRVAERTAQITNANIQLQEQIGERMLIEAELRASVERYFVLTQTLQDAVIGVEANGVIILWNKSAEKMFGYSQDEAIGQNIQDLIIPARYHMDKAKGFEVFAKSGKGPVIGHTLEFSALRKDGSEFPIELSVSALKKRDTWQTTGIIRDISERKITEEALRTNEENFRNIAENSRDGILITTFNGGFIYSNNSFLQITGYSQEELNTVNFNTIFAPIDSTLQSYNVFDLIRNTNNDASHFEFKISSKEVFVELSHSYTYWKGQPSSLIIVRDITARKKAIEEEINCRVKNELQKHYTFEGIISRNENIKKIFDTLPVIAESDVSVLVLGESGTGKELLVRAIHRLSTRKKKSFITVNCGALPDTLLESELFGYKAGAFTDAKRNKKGFFSLARGGTIFLDEIGDISATMQLKLLRVLEDKTFFPLGSEEPESADFRLISATNKDLEKMVKNERYRSDLYYRINVFQFEIPPLRSRKDDIPLLIEHFIEIFNQLHGKHIKGISTEALSVLMSYDYPGNVRELENIIERALVICSGDYLMTEHLPTLLVREIINAPTNVMPIAKSISDTVGEFEAQVILNTLNKNNWNKNRTAQDLGINRITLYRKMSKLGIMEDDRRLTAYD